MKINLLERFLQNYFKEFWVKVKATTKLLVNFFLSSGSYLLTYINVYICYFMILPIQVPQNKGYSISQNDLEH